MDGMQHLWFWGGHSSTVPSLCEALSTEVNGSEYCRKLQWLKLLRFFRWHWQLGLLLSPEVKSFCSLFVGKALAEVILKDARFGMLALRVAAELVSWGIDALAVVSEVWPSADLPWNQGLDLWGLPQWFRPSTVTQALDLRER